LQRIALLALVEHQRDARIGEDVLGVHASCEISSSGEPSAAVATLTSEQ
jgi:hypothetical protein